MTKMAATPIHGKNLKRLLLQNQKVNDLETWCVALGCGAYQVCSNGDPRLTLTYLKSWSNLHPYAIKYRNIFEKFILNTVEYLLKKVILWKLSMH